MLHGPAHPVACLTQLDHPVAHDRGGVGHDRPGPQLVQGRLLGVQPRGEHAAQALAGRVQAHGLLGEVGDDPAGGVGGGGGPVVGHQVQQGAVGLVADRRDQRRAAGGRGAHEPLIGEGQQVLDGAAPAGHDDDVDLRIGVERLDGPGDLADGARPLDGDLAHLEGQAGPAQAGVDQHVVLGLGLASAHEAHLARQEGQGPLALGVEQTLGGQDAAQLLDAGQQVADADGPDVVGLQLERAPLGPEGGLGAHHHTGALAELGAGAGQDGVEDPSVDGHRHGDVGVRVPQGEEGHAGAGAAVELDDLPLHPHLAHAGDVLVDLGGQQPQRPRVLRGGEVRSRRQLPGAVGAAGVAGAAARVETGRTAGTGGGLRAGLGGALACHMHHCATSTTGDLGPTVAQW